MLHGASPCEAASSIPFMIYFAQKVGEQAARPFDLVMSMKKYDVIYILKNDINVGELRCSLRSIEKNLEHGDVWFVCGQPKGFVPDHRLVISQVEKSKWERVRGSLLKVCECKDVPNKFWLFNDDFYVLKPVTSEAPLYQGLLRDHILRVEKRHGAITGYTKRLRECEQVLKDAELSTFDYAVHMPMLIDKKKMLETLKTFPTCPMFRCLYGNYAEIGGVMHPDVKVLDVTEGINPNADYLSTDNTSFTYGQVGCELREMFKDKCRYEK